jgi:hypothetical protein
MQQPVSPALARITALEARVQAQETAISVLVQVVACLAGDDAAAPWIEVAARNLADSAARAPDETIRQVMMAARDELQRLMTVADGRPRPRALRLVPAT